MYIYFYIITDFVFIFQLVPCKSCHFNNLLAEAGVMHEAGYVDYLEHLVPLLKLDINILSILHYLGSPLGFCTLIFDLMRNLHIYNACTYIHSILLTGGWRCWWTDFVPEAIHNPVAIKLLVLGLLT